MRACESPSIWNEIDEIRPRLRHVLGQVERNLLENLKPLSVHRFTNIPGGGGLPLCPDGGVILAPPALPAHVGLLARGGLTERGRRGGVPGCLEQGSGEGLELLHLGIIVVVDRVVEGGLEEAEGVQRVFGGQFAIPAKIGRTL